jgi:hypothetical protein
LPISALVDFTTLSPLSLLEILEESQPLTGLKPPG